MAKVDFNKEILAVIFQATNNSGIVAFSQTGNLHAVYVTPTTVRVEYPHPTTGERVTKTVVVPDTITFTEV